MKSEWKPGPKVLSRLLRHLAFTLGVTLFSVLLIAWFEGDLTWVFAKTILALAAAMAVAAAVKIRLDAKRLRIDEDELSFGSSRYRREWAGETHPFSVTRRTMRAAVVLDAGVAFFYDRDGDPARARPVRISLRLFDEPEEIRGMLLSWAGRARMPAPSADLVFHPRAWALARGWWLILPLAALFATSFTAALVPMSSGAVTILFLVYVLAGWTFVALKRGRSLRHTLRISPEAMFRMEAQSGFAADALRFEEAAGIEHRRLAAWLWPRSFIVFKTSGQERSFETTDYRQEDVLRTAVAAWRRAHTP